MDFNAAAPKPGVIDSVINEHPDPSETQRQHLKPVSKPTGVPKSKKKFVPVVELFRQFDSNEEYKSGIKQKSENLMKELEKTYKSFGV